MKRLNILRKIFYLFIILNMTACSLCYEKISNNTNHNSNRFKITENRSSLFVDNLNEYILARVEKNDTVYFPEGQYILKPCFFNLLNRISTFLVNHRNYRIIVEGNIFPKNGLKNEIMLGKARFYEIKYFLIKSGVDEDQIFLSFHATENKESSLKERMQSYFVSKRDSIFLHFKNEIN